MKCPQCDAPIRKMTWQEAYPASSGLLCTNEDCQRVFLGWGAIHTDKLEYSPTFVPACVTRQRTVNDKV